MSKTPRLDELTRWCVYQKPGCKAHVVANSCGTLLDYDDVRAAVAEDMRAVEAENAELRELCALAAKSPLDRLDDELKLQRDLEAAARRAGK